MVCGFAAGDTVLVFDDTGASDTFRVTGTQGNQVQLEIRGSAISKTYPVGSIITRATTHTYYLDSAAAQLAHYDGWDTDTPMVDDVVGLRFRYFGDPNPPTSPRPPVGAGNCLFGPVGNPLLPTLPSGSGSLVELQEAQLTDGPWCGTVNRFDADLYRIRTVAVELRMQAGSADLRGSDPTLFLRSGDAIQGARMLPDRVINFNTRRVVEATVALTGNTQTEQGLTGQRGLGALNQAFRDTAVGTLDGELTRSQMGTGSGGMVEQ